jgi:HD-like signal output (HDOD) protein
MVNEKTLRTLKQKIGKLPMISADVFEIISLLDRPESNFDKIVEKVSPGLATRFLSMANSAYYGREVRSIHFAVQLLGYRRMKDILISSILMNHFTDRLKNFDFDKFHKQAQFCAAVSNVLGEILAYEKPEDLFTVAVLQNIGKLVIAVYFKDEHEKIIALKKREGLSTALAEQKVMGINHAEIGAMVLERFTLPEAICEAVRFHDLASGEISGNSNRRLNLIAREATCVADRFALPEKMAPREIPGLLKKTIEEGKKKRHESVRTGMRLKGYDDLFPALLKQASSLVFQALKEYLPERIPRMKEAPLSNPE